MTLPQNNPLPRRIVVVGTSGSGKTTFARNLAERLGIPHIELDAIHWGPGWTPAPVDLFRARTSQALSGEAWSVDGNYSAVREIVWPRADTIVWLDYALPVVMSRVIVRTFRRVITREELWSGNRERVFTAIFGRDSIIRWALTTYGRRRREYPVLFRRPEYAHLRIVLLRSPRQARLWLESLPAANRQPDLGGNRP